jgi:hypothetical protein
MGSVANVSEVYAASTFRVEVCRMGEVLCMHRILYRINSRERGTFVPGLIRTADREN